MTVRILEDALVNQIAAGEVVERPASVVKELVENALDAAAKTIGVRLKNGGRSLIRVVDDGIGMREADALMCIERHATSKIRSQHDLVHVGTLGFRGEALPSIASVSRFRITTRQGDEEVGTRVRIEGGRLAGVERVGCAAGTEIDVSSLFYNVPVRRGFMRTVTTELGHCVEAVARQALVRPDVDFTVRHQGREILRLPRAIDRGRRAADVLGEPGRSLVPVLSEDGAVRVDGLVSPPGLHRPSAQRGVYLYVNGRYVRDPVVRRAVREAYRGVLPQGRHPVVVLEVRLPPDVVDVNVHPSKVEVRFRDPTGVVHAVSDAVREALARSGVPRPRPSRHETGDERPLLPFGGAPAVEPGVVREPAQPVGYHGGARSEGPPERSSEPAEPVSPPPSGPVEVRRPMPAPHEPAAGSPSESPVPPFGVEAERPEPLSSSRRFRGLQVVGSTPRWVVYSDGGTLGVLDRLAATRCVIAARLAADLRDTGVESQRLLVPRVIALGAGLVQRLRPRFDTLERFGFDVAEFAAGEVVARAIPPIAVDVDLEVLLRQVAELRGEVSNERLGRLLAAHVATGGDEVEPRGLLAALDEVPLGDERLWAHLDDAMLTRLLGSGRLR